MPFIGTYDNPTVVRGYPNFDLIVDERNGIIRARVDAVSGEVVAKMMTRSPIIWTIDWVRFVPESKRRLPWPFSRK